MIKLAFVGPQRKVIEFTIKKKEVKYFDEIWKSGIQIYPLNLSLITKLKRSGDKNIQFMAAFILDANKRKDFKEYQSCKTEEDIANFIRKDAQFNGLLEVK